MNIAHELQGRYEIHLQWLGGSWLSCGSVGSSCRVGIHVRSLYRGPDMVRAGCTLSHWNVTSVFSFANLISSNSEAAVNCISCDSSSSQRDAVRRQRGMGDLILARQSIVTTSCFLSSKLDYLITGGLLFCHHARLNSSACLRQRRRGTVRQMLTHKGIHRFESTETSKASSG
jgi:hypothetical protein